MIRTTGLKEVKGVGEKTAALYAKKGIRTAGELLEYYPLGYDFFAEPLQVSQAADGKIVTLSLVIIGNVSTVKRGSRTITHLQAGDETGEIRLTFFNMPYIRKSLLPGSTHLFRGVVRVGRNGARFMEQPKVYSRQDYEKVQGSLQPRYGVTPGLTNNAIIKTMHRVLEQYEFGEDYLSEEDLRRLDLIGEEQAVRQIHFPQSRQALGEARNRRIFDEFFTFILAVRRQKAQETDLLNSRPMHPDGRTQELIDALPYALTGAQRQAWQEIEADLCGKYVMNRLLQGDVGSGKTIVAFLALLLCACNGRQGAMMAPTEVLATQHMENLQELIERYELPLHPVLLTGSVTGRARRNIYEQIATGYANVILGTHALIQDAVDYADLGLVITDEQHRFGVRQRESLAGKGVDVPVLVMSATPIPRTLAIILYGDLQISTLREMPVGRLPIRNLAIDQGARGRVYRFVLQEIAKGHQAYVICPAVEAGEMDDLENVTDYTEKLRGSLPPEIRIDSLNGRMKPAAKNDVMARFAAHETDILVSTTVIEVGINVPNATVMVVENAERFGLSQLHQLRGRVGRGKDQSYCVFLYSGEKKPKRLEILEHTNDGFAIAQQDLQLRGPGDLFGVQQSGELGFVLADVYEDAGIMQKAAAEVDRVLREDPERSFAHFKSVDFRSI